MTLTGDRRSPVLELTEDWLSPCCLERHVLFAAIRMLEARKLQGWRAKSLPSDACLVVGQIEGLERV